MAFVFEYKCVDYSTRTGKYDCSHRREFFETFKRLCEGRDDVEFFDDVAVVNEMHERENYEKSCSRFRKGHDKGKRYVFTYPDAYGLIGDFSPFDGDGYVIWCFFPPEKDPHECESEVRVSLKGQTPENFAHVMFANSVLSGF